LADAPAEALRRAADSLERQAEVPPKLALGVGTPVGEPLFRELPDAFIRVELGGVAGEAIEMQPGEGATQRPDRVSLVNGSVVPHEDDWPSKMPKQVPEKGADLGVLDVLVVEGVVQAETSAAWAHRDRGDDRDSIAPLPVVEQRRLAPRRPGLAHTRDQEEARLVGEGEVSTQPRGFFLMRGHSCFFQRSIASSFRSRARRSGFWCVKPRAWSSRPT